LSSRETISLHDAVARLGAGGAVAFPTETVFGLGADAMNRDAVERVYAIKGRPRNKPMPVVVADIAMGETVTDGLVGRARRLAQAFWPGPLTLVCPVRDTLPDIVTARGATVELRSPGLASLRELISGLGKPLIAPSANRSGGEPARSLDELQDIFAHEISTGDLACFGPPDSDNSGQQPSTILIPGATPGADQILRAGPISENELRNIN
jgi:L-threonylcarbamoyladenylate synthase